MRTSTLQNTTVYDTFKPSCSVFKPMFCAISMMSSTEACVVVVVDVWALSIDFLRCSVPK